ncbi:MAG: hypothetical protein ACLFOC_11600 [Campylobacterales bacterium]
MIPAKPFKFVCPKCGYSRVLKLDSDVINPADMIRTCPKCSTEMEKKELNAIDKIFGAFR